MVQCSLGCLKLSPVALLVYLCLLNSLMYMERGGLASLITTLKDDHNMRLSSSQAGVLGSVFMGSFIIANPLFANASQTIHPFTLTAIGVTIWAGCALLAAVSRTFWLLVIARAVSGIGEACFVFFASPTILSKAPSDKKNLWISIYSSALTIGYALGYVLGPQIKDGFGGWYYFFYMEVFLSVPLILVAVFAYRDPTLLFRKEKKVSLGAQLKELSKNSAYVLLVLGYAATQFTIGGLAFWGPTIIQIEYEKSETVASSSLGAITIISGIVATVFGSQILEYMAKPFRKEFEEGMISKKKHSYYITEKALKALVRFIALSGTFLLTGSIFARLLPGPIYEGPFVFFFLCLAIGEFFLFLGNGPTIMAIMNSVDEELRPQAVAVSSFFMHLFGDAASPLLMGVVIDASGMYLATCLLTGWIMFAAVFWFGAFGIARFHGAPKGYVVKHFCELSVVRHEDDKRLLDEDRNGGYSNLDADKSVNPVKGDGLI